MGHIAVPVDRAQCEAWTARRPSARGEARQVGYRRGAGSQGIGAGRIGAFKCGRANEGGAGVGGGCVKVASKAKFLISYANMWSSLIGLGTVSGFFAHPFWCLFQLSD